MVFSDFLPSPSCTPASNLQSCQTPQMSAPPSATIVPGEYFQQQGTTGLDATTRLFDHWTSPPPVPSSHSDPRPSPPIPSANSSALDVYRHLSRILFDLRRERGRQSSGLNQGALRLDEVFPSVSSLCDILQSVLSPRGDLNLSAPAEEETCATFMLASTAVSMVLDIYRSSSRLYSSSPEILNGGRCPPPQWLGVEASNEAVSPTSPPQQPNTYQRLNSVLQLTIMDFHLAQLQRIFNHLDHTDSNQAVLACADDGSANIQELRGILQSSIEKLKADTSSVVAHGAP